jgi:hypothetical protein
MQPKRRIIDGRDGWSNSNSIFVQKILVRPIRSSAVTTSTLISGFHWEVDFKQVCIKLLFTLQQYWNVVSAFQGCTQHMPDDLRSLKTTLFFTQMEIHQSPTGNGLDMQTIPNGFPIPHFLSPSLQSFFSAAQPGKQLFVKEKESRTVSVVFSWAPL